MATGIAPTPVDARVRRTFHIPGEVSPARLLAVWQALDEAYTGLVVLDMLARDDAMLAAVRQWGNADRLGGLVEEWRQLVPLDRRLRFVGLEAGGSDNMVVEGDEGILAKLARALSAAADVVLRAWRRLREGIVAILPRGADASRDAALAKAVLDQDPQGRLRQIIDPAALEDLIQSQSQIPDARAREAALLATLHLLLLPAMRLVALGVEPQGGER